MYVYIQSTNGCKFYISVDVVYDSIELSISTFKTYKNIVFDNECITI